MNTNRQIPASGNALRCSLLTPLPRLYFAHTPKTGGVGLMTVLRDAYGARARFPIYTRRHLTRYTAADLAQYRLYGGHWGIGLLAVLPADTVTLTVLRDPVEQTISWWHHMRRIILHNPAWYARTRTLWQPILDQDLAGTLASPFLAGLMTDMQCKYLGLAFDFRPYLGQGDQCGAALQDDFHTAFAGSNTLPAYEQASLNLESMGFVGITEHFEETVRTLCRYLGVPAPQSAPQVNLNPHKQTPVLSYYRDRLDRGILRQIEAMTRCDRLLYEQGLARLARQSAQPSPPALALRALPAARAVFYRSRRWFWRWAVQTAPPLAALRR